MIAARGSDGVNLVKENDARGGGTSFAEDFADGALRFANVHANQLGALDGNEV